ncbi:MAG: hypothetical protein WD733_18330 [Bryobacterales bacterium]|jgi:hypothetical protein
MPRWKVARGKKKAGPAGRATAIGCVTAIVLVLLFFLLMFWIALRPK